MTLLLAFALSAGYRPDRPGNRADMRAELVVIAALVLAMVLAFDEAVR